MAKKALVYKLPEKYIVIVGKEVGFARSQYHAQNVAADMGAIDLEHKPWQDLLLPPTSSSRVASRGPSSKKKGSRKVT